MGAYAPSADVARQLAALRDDAAVVELDDRALLVARGGDRASFLQGMLSNEVVRRTAGEGSRALLLTEQGRVVSALRVHVLGDEIWLDVDRGTRSAVRAALERFLVADDVELEERPAAAVAVRGPRAAERVAELAGISPNELGQLVDGAHRELSLAGVPARAARACDRSGDGFALWVADGAAAARVLDAFRAAGVAEAGQEALEALRIAAGEAREGIDFDESTLAPEVPSLAPAISYRKGCYLGQEVVERVAARGHVNWTIARLALDATAPPDRGAAVFHRDSDVGRVTSAARLPGDGAIAILARVRRTAADEGSGLAVDVGGTRVAARVVPDPPPSE